MGARDSGCAWALRSIPLSSLDQSESNCQTAGCAYHMAAICPSNEPSGQSSPFRCELLIVPAYSDALRKGAMESERIERIASRWNAQSGSTIGRYACIVLTGKGVSAASRDWLVEFAEEVELPIGGIPGIIVCGSIQTKGAKPISIANLKRNHFVFGSSASHQLELSSKLGSFAPCPRGIGLTTECPRDFVLGGFDRDSSWLPEALRSRINHYRVHALSRILIVEHCALVRSSSIEESPHGKTLQATQAKANASAAASLRNLLQRRTKRSPKEGAPKIQSTVVPATTPCLWFLGTGAAAPSKRRNCTSLLLWIPNPQAGPNTNVASATNPNGNFILIDCGEGALGTLYRMFGSRMSWVLRNLKLLWNSHHHADHHCGMLAFLHHAHEMGVQFPVACPPVVRNSLAPFLPPSWVVLDSFDQPSIDTVIATAVPGIRVAQSIPVQHCRFAAGLRVEFQSGVKFVFSGDTSFTKQHLQMTELQKLPPSGTPPLARLFA